MTNRESVPASCDFDALARGAQFRDRIGLRVKASPEAIFDALHTVGLQDIKLAWLLGEIRYLPSRLAGRAPEFDPKAPFISNLTEGATLVLHDDEPHEIITGSAGRLHRIRDQSPVRFESREAFDAFEDPEYEKLFMSIRVVPSEVPGEHWLVLDHATRALSPEPERKFRRYWRIIKPTGALDVEGRLACLHAERYCDIGGGKAVLTPWTGRYGEYREFDGFRIPTSVEVSWDLEKGTFSYARFRITRIDYNVLSGF